MNKLIDFLHRLGPVTTAVLISLILSIIAIEPLFTPNRDAMYYLEAAKAYQSGGWLAADQVFNWPFLSVLIGKLSAITGLSVEDSGYLLSTVFLGPPVD